MFPIHPSNRSAYTDLCELQPIMDVTSSDIICQVPGSTSSSVVDVPAGAKVGTYWGHVIGGEQYAGDVDHPIAASHKGPIAVYL